MENRVNTVFQSLRGIVYFLLMLFSIEDSTAITAKIAGPTDWTHHPYHRVQDDFQIARDRDTHAPIQI